MPNRCLACGSNVTKIANAVVAPWITEISGQKDPQFTTLLNCENCEFSFFEKRFSDNEMSAMYSGYRSDNYFAVRNSWEPWYRRTVNDAYTNESDHLDERVSFMTNILVSAGLQECKTVVDFGGDEGQFFPEIDIQERIVIDVSNKPLRKNVSRAPSLGDVKAKIDLIVAAHIAEHVNDPIDFFNDLISHLNSGSYLYVEVPMDRPSIKSHHATENYAKMLSRISSGSKRKFIAHDFTSGIARQFGFSIPRRGVVKQSEHLNYYNLKSITTLLEKLGTTVLKTEATPDAKVGGLRLGRLGTLVVKN
jgi:hypothetical protein